MEETQQPTSLAEGLLAGRYRFVREMGRGATGRVLEVFDTLAGEARAAKVVLPVHAAHLRVEFDLLRGIAHPNLTSVFELLTSSGLGEPFGIGKGATVLIEELADGSPALAALEPYRTDRNRIVDAVTQIGVNVASALSALHREGLIHGDVKPANIVVSDDLQTVRLVDLGLARPGGSHGVAFGTPIYLSPEAWQGHRSVASDVFALGATLYDLISGSGAGDSDTVSVGEIVQRAFTKPRRISALHDVPATLRRLLEALLGHDPEARATSAREVATRLAAIRTEVGLEPQTLLLGGDEPSPEERALEISALPIRGRDAEVDELAALLSGGGSMQVVGPPGAGRERVVQEAITRFQLSQAAAGAEVPSSVVFDSQVGDYEIGAHPIVVQLRSDVGETELRGELLRAELASSVVALVVISDRAHDDIEHGVELGALTEDAFRQLLDDAVRQSAPDDVVDAARTATGGLPGRLCRLLKKLYGEGRDPLDAASFELDVRQADDPFIPSGSRRATERLAVAGGGLAAHALGASAEEITPLVSMGLLTVDPEEVRLRPDVALWVWESLDPEERRERADSLDVEQLGVVARAYWTAAHGDRDAAADAFAAAVDSERRSGHPERAARLGAAALDVIKLESPKLRTVLAAALRSLGRYRDALARLSDGGPPGLRAELHRLAGEAERALAIAADRDEPPFALIRARLAYDKGDYKGVAETIAAVATDSDSDDTQFRLRELQVLTALARGQEPVALDGLLADARSHGDPAVEARALSIAASVARSQGELGPALSLQTRAVAAARLAGERHLAVTLTVNEGLMRLDSGDIGHAVDALREGARWLTSLGHESAVARVAYNLALAAALVGDDDLARVGATRAVRVAADAGDRAVVAYGSVLLAELSLRAGDLSEARAALARRDEIREGLGPSVDAVVRCRYALIAAALSEVELAESLLDSPPASSDLLATAEHRCARARLAVLTGSGDEALSRATAALSIAEEIGTFEHLLRALLVVGDAAELHKRTGVATSALGRARAILDRAAETLPPAARARLRAVSSYQRAFRSLPRAPSINAGPSSEIPPPDVGPRWKTLAGLAKRLNAERRVQRLFDEILDAAIRLTGAERGFVVTRVATGGLEVLSARGLRLATPTDGRFSRSIAARAIDHGEVVSTVDALTDEALEGAASVHALSLRSVLAVPLRRRSGISVIYLDDRLRPGAFDETDRALVVELAELSAIALDGAEMLRAERVASRRLRALERKLSDKVEAQALHIASLRKADAASRFTSIVAESAAMRRVITLVEKVAASDVPVLIVGESGSGKELVARAVHEWSPRRDEPFIGENCGAIADELLESALFGHVRGAFTGADRSRLGLFAAADGGTLFLDEIGEMSTSMQTKLLRAVQDGEIRPVGSERSRKVDVRIVAATHRDLRRMVQEGKFREDLFYRLAVMDVAVPPLRERREDVAPLVMHFVERYAEGRHVGIDEQALVALTTYGWPGNVRELQNEVQRALVLAADEIGIEHLSPAIAGDEGGDSLDLKLQTERLERRLIESALRRVSGNQTKAAKLLGVSRYGLQKMIKRLNIAR